MAALLQRLEAKLAPLGAEQVRMFGGVCFMLNGNMAVGTSKRGLLVRTGPGNDSEASARAGASPMVMRGKPMAGYWFIDENSLDDPAEFDYWIDLALTNNRSLPPKSRKK